MLEQKKYITFGIAANEQEGLRWLKIAAEKDFSQAMYIIGTYFESKKNYSKATYWYQLAADKGNNEAIVKLKEMRQHGCGEAANFMWQS